ncbi:hypothetical protein [Mesorhizobium sp. B4-1-1]|uniref:hypothetical protein n=1 Tax=Mesorhizobium sp. B4-1-1 TaxID=2589890 RepID=UPI00112825D6|nr:hypothetical protein [Mesorhizobium sp. B4-1-1]TPI10277.1 hypothetical protein FJW10_29630 [Mesorhizobium sp. B4-1-1]
MLWQIALAIISFASQLLLGPKPQNAKPKSLEDFQAPTAEEGRELGVAFGTVDIADPNVTWYGDLLRRAIKGARRYLIAGPRQILGYKYSLGMQMGLCHGPADALLRITVGDKVAWRGVSTGGRVNINKSSLFGGDKSEGGIKGAIDVCMGSPDQSRNDYLLAKLGETISAYRGIVTIVLRQVYLGTSAYLKPWEFRLQRIHVRSDGSAQWYDAKAAIPGFEISTDDTGREALSETGAKNIDTNGDYAASGDSSGVVRTWLMPDGARQEITLPGTNFHTSVHITDFDELVVRSGGNVGGSAPTYLEFRDVANPSSIIQTIDLDGMIADVGAGGLNFGFVMCDVSVAGGSFALVGIKDGATANPRFWILLERVTVGTIDQWAVSGWHARVNSALGVPFSMGKTYAYRAINDKNIIRLTWNGAWAETIVTLAEVTGTAINVVSYNEATNKVVVVDDNGGIYVYSEDLSTLVRSSLGNSARLGDKAISSRMSMGSSTVVIPDASAAGAITRFYFVPIADLAMDTYVDVANSKFARKGSTMLGVAYNASNGYVVAEGSPYLVFWLIAATVFDMNPAHIVRECLTDANWGMGYTDDDIDGTSFTYAADTFFSELFGVSLRWVQESEIEEFVSNMLGYVDAYLYGSRSTGKFVLKPIRDDYDFDLIPLLIEADILEFTEIKRRMPSQATNSVLVKYYNRAKRKTGSHRVTNTAKAMQSTGNVPPASREYPGINRSDLAIRVGTRDAIALGSGLISGRIIVKPRDDLNPGDPFRIVSARYRLAGEVQRVTGLRFGDGRDNKMGVTLFQDVFKLGRTVIVDDGDTGGGWTPPSSDPLPVSPRLAWEMPYREARQMVGDPALATMLAGDPGAGLLQVAGISPTPDAANADLMADAGGGYADSELIDFAPGGFIVGDLAIDATTVTLNAGSGVDATAIGLLATIGDGSRFGTEVVRVDAVSGATLTIARGCLDTVPQAHADGADFVLFDDLSTSDFQPYTDGQSASVKMLTNTGQGQLSLGAAPVDNVEFESRAIRPYRPANVTLTG